MMLHKRGSDDITNEKMRIPSCERGASPSGVEDSSIISGSNRYMIDSYQYRRKKFKSSN